MKSSKGNRAKWHTKLGVARFLHYHCWSCLRYHEQLIKRRGFGARQITPHYPNAHQQRTEDIEKKKKKKVRPIALTPNLSKLLEYPPPPVQPIKLLCPGVDPTQYGAVTGSSTTHSASIASRSIWSSRWQCSLARLVRGLHKSVWPYSSPYSYAAGETTEKNGVPPLSVNWYHGFLCGRKPAR